MLCDEIVTQEEMDADGEFHQINAKKNRFSCEIDWRFVEAQKQPFVNPECDSEIDCHRGVQDRHC